jgi:hypothetical protein
VVQPGALHLAQTGTRAHQLRLRAAKVKLHGMNYDGITRDVADRLHPLVDFGGIRCIIYEPEGGSRTLMSLRPETRDGSRSRDYAPEYRPQEGGLARLVTHDKPFLDRDAAPVMRNAPRGTPRPPPGRGRHGPRHRRRADLPGRRGQPPRHLRHPCLKGRNTPRSGLREERRPR